MDALVDLSDEDFLNHKHKLKMAVQPLLNDHSVNFSMCDFNEVSY